MQQQNFWTRAAPGILILILSTQPLDAQKQAPTNQLRTPDPLHNPSTPAKVELGRFLYESPLLSRNRKISCATCHDPEASFADGLEESRGIFETEVGRNSPTLWAISLHPGFLGEIPDPRDTLSRRRKIKTLSLEERCLTPIENPIEMGNDMKSVLRTLKAVEGLRQRFDDAFGKTGIGISEDRIGKSLAAFLRNVEMPSTPFRRFMDADTDALTGSELRGLAIFRDRGQCAACHSGGYLSDGRIHQVAALDGFRAVEGQRKARQRLQQLMAKANSERKKKTGSRINPLTPGRARKGQRATDLVSSNQHRPSGYGQTGIQANGVQTPTLWDVARTGPYFRDGSVDNLEIAVRQHVAELRQAGTVNNCGTVAVPNPILAQLPRRLRPRWGQTSNAPKPADLNHEEIADLMEFLGALSPRPGER